MSPPSHLQEQQSIAENEEELALPVSTTAVVDRRLEAALTRMSKRAARYEYQMKELEHKFSESLSNFRAIDSLLQEAFTGLKRNSKRAEHALTVQIPDVNTELEESLHVLKELGQTLPTIQTQVTGIRSVYDSGRRKAQDLVEDLEWMNTEFYERWRRIIFTSTKSRLFSVEGFHALPVYGFLCGMLLVGMDSPHGWISCLSTQARLG
ncbi:hypothetical protein VNI00_000758 [Paramarasmius palmivorus]|uniref:Uncharacterized protein n=1 Tax=Paramarasmius palmivorus TaxID=297713 RepID=A0AAW0E6Q0_9AGAR